VRRGPISTGTATVCAIGIAAVLTIAVAAVLLVPGGGAGIPGLAAAFPASSAEVVTGYADAPAIRISGTESAINLTECRIYLIDPEGTLRGVETAILANATLGVGQAAYIFNFPVDDRPAASGYWITDEPEMVFTTAYHPGVHPFSPGGDWRVVVYDQTLRKNRVDRVVPVNEPSSPA